MQDPALSLTLGFMSKETETQSKTRSGQPGVVSESYQQDTSLDQRSITEGRNSFNCGESLSQLQMLRDEYGVRGDHGEPPWVGVSLCFQETKNASSLGLNCRILGV